MDSVDQIEEIAALAAIYKPLAEDEDQRLLD
ncbi:MAG: hypothetical protein AVDCRST_MAG88-4709, partial [uncultured Thermomicrobiales bacterium]